jgi:hypothetical protein
VEPEGSGERQGRSVAHCNGLSGGPKSSASAGRAIEPKLGAWIWFRRWTPKRPWSPKAPVNVEDVRERPKTLGRAPENARVGGIQRGEGPKSFAHSAQNVEPRKARPRC